MGMGMGMGIGTRKHRPWCCCCSGSGSGRRLQIVVLAIVALVVGPYLVTTQGFFILGRKGADGVVDVDELRLRGVNLPELNELARELLVRNGLPPRNQDLFPVLAEDRVVIVLYVHYRPKYLELVVKALAEVRGINETLLVVSHDGFYEDMNAIVEGIRFCQVRWYLSSPSVLVICAVDGIGLAFLIQFLAVSDGF